MRRYFWLFGLCLPALCSASVDTAHADGKNLYFGEAYYYAYLERHIDAITRLDIAAGRYYGLDKSNPDPLHYRFGNASITVGDFELAYRMPQRAGHAIKAIYENTSYPAVRNEAAYLLARIFLQNGELEYARQTVEQISGKISGDFLDDVLFLRAQIYMATGKFADAARTLRELQDSKKYKGFAAYNLGVALIKSGQENQGVEQLEKAGKIFADDDVTLSIRDKANLALGYRFMAARQPALAKQYLDRVRLSGPFSNKALLGSGWADAELGDFEGALAPWSVLVKRNMADISVQESMLGVPYAYARLDLPGKATVQYGKALEGFGRELARLDASLKSVRDGKFLQALLQPTLKQDKDWIARLSALPETPETSYLLEMMASDDFQEALRNYLDLDDLLSRLATWDESLNAYEELIKLRHQYYESVLPGIDRQFLALDARLRPRLEQRQKLDTKIKDMQAFPPPENDNLLADTYEHLEQLDDEVKKIKNIYNAYSSLRKSITQTYQGYDDQLRQLKSRVFDSRQKAATLLIRQGQMLETMAIRELDQRRKQLHEYQAQARFALAESYERASKKQAATK